MKNTVTQSTAVLKPSYLKKVGRDMLRDRWLYLLLLPGILFFLIFKYAPMYGLKIAFQEYNAFSPDSSPFVGVLQFRKLFTSPSFPSAFRNTLTISCLKLLFGFPIPIILALLINEFRSIHFKKITQTVLYLPHFISWVIMGGIIIEFLNPSDGLINKLIVELGGEKLDFLTNQHLFVPMLIVTEIYKTMGWGTIVYFAAISGVDEQQYEAAIIDGANRFKQAIYITLPVIKSTIIIMFILSMGNILNAGFDQIFMLYNALVYQVADIIDTFVYRKGIIDASFSFSAAAGMFKSVIALILIVATNRLAKLFGEDGIW